jgi:PAS domain S-box-containing protein
MPQLERRFGRYADHVADGLFLTDHDQRFVEVNAEGCRMLGYTRDELLELTLPDVAPGFGPDAVRGLWDSTFVGQPVTIDSESRRKDGSLFPVEVRVARLEEDGQELMLAVVRDATARKESEAELMARAERQAAVAELGRRALAELGTQALMEEAARAVRGALSVDYTSVLELRLGGESLLLRAGTGWHDGHVGTTVVSVTDTHAGQTLEHGGPVIVADLAASGYAGSTVLRAHGVVSGVSAVVEGRTGPCGLMGAYTTTAREFTEDDVTFVQTVANVLGAAITREREERLQAHLERSHRVEAVGQLAGGIAHDFNNLLSIIRNYTQFAIEETDQLPELRADLEEVEKAATRAIELNRGLLVFSGQDIHQAELVDVNGLLRDSEGMLRRAIPQDIALRIDLAEDLWPTRAGTDQLEQILVNLAVNARAAMPDGGVLSVTTENLEFDDDHGGDRDGPAGRFVRLTVADNGASMPEDVTAHAFDLFFSTKSRGHGSGLGLATVHGIARQLGGYVQLYSAPSLGTAVKVYLPAADPDDGPAQASSPEAHAGHGETVLVVDDEAPLRRVTCRILSEHGYDVIEADCAESALAVWQERAGEIDLLLTDAMMPAGSGAELVDRLRAFRPALAVLLMSGYGGGVAGGNGARVVGKPFSTPGLLRSVREALGEPA